MVDTERIKKLLKLTTSPFEGEALNAIRKANEEIKRNGQTWDDVLSEKSSSNDSYRNINYINEINRLRDRLNEKAREQNKIEAELQRKKVEIHDLERACEVYKHAARVYGDIKSGKRSEPETKKEKQQTGFEDMFGKQKKKPEYYEASSGLGGTYDAHGRYIPKSKRRD